MSQQVKPTCHHYCNTMNCPECFRAFWRWLENHAAGRGKRTVGKPSFYEAAARCRNPQWRAVS